MTISNTSCLPQKSQKIIKEKTQTKKQETDMNLNTAVWEDVEQPVETVTESDPLVLQYINIPGNTTQA